MPWSEQLHSFMQQQQWRKWWPKYAEGNVQWWNINFMIFIIFHIKISYSVSISWLSSFSHSIEDREIVLFIKEDISFKIIHLNLKHSHDIFIRDKWNFSSLLWRFSNLVTFLMSSPWTSSCPIVYKGVIWTLGLDFYTSTKCSSDKSCLFFFITKVFVLNYATEGKVLFGASREIFVKRHLGNVKKNNTNNLDNKKEWHTYDMILLQIINWIRHFQLTLRQKYMYLQHGCHSHRFTKFPRKFKISLTSFKISQIGSSDHFQPPHNHSLHPIIY